MEIAVGTSATRKTVNASERTESGSADGQIVVVRPQVLETVGHVLGNLFQRIYHLIERARETDGVTAADLENTTHRLEDFLQLVMDYVSPLAVSLQEVSVTDVAQSLARQISDATGCPVRIDATLSTDARLLVDAGRLARSFGLLAAPLLPNPTRDGTVDLKAVTRPAGRSLHLTAVVPCRFLPARSSELEMHRAVAEKLLDIQGGALQFEETAGGDARWVITLPLRS